MRRRSVVTFAQRLGLVLLAALLPLGSLRVRASEDLDPAALLHDSRSDLYRTPGGAVPTDSSVILRFRTAAGNADAVTVRLYDQFKDEQTLLPMAVAATTPDGYDLWEATVEAGRKPTILWYRFLVTQGDQTLYYEDDTRPGDGSYVPANEGGPGTVYEQSPDLSWQISVYDPDYYTPEWMRNAVIYQIFPDRFRNGDKSNDPVDGTQVFYGDLALIFHETWNEPPINGREVQAPSGGQYANSDFFGGDLAGITQELDYLQQLGVTAIYLNPIFLANSNHRYDTVDYRQIDPILGSLDDFNTLVSEAKQRGIVLILDGVFNHMSSDSPFFDRYHRYNNNGACESVNSPYRSWFFFVAPAGAQPSPCAETPDGATYYTSWGGFDSIPKINNAEQGPKNYFFMAQDSVVSYWGKAGIGGWRLDVAGDIDPGPGVIYWETFRGATRFVNPEAVIVGEEWHDASKWLLGSEWDSVMNYRLRMGILGFVRDVVYQDNDSNGDNIIRPLAPSEVDGLIRAIEEDYPPMAYHALMNVLDSHDTSRLLFVAGNDKQRQKLAALLQFTLPGAPTVYYGDEIALDAPSQPDSGGNLQDDPFNRAPYPWPDESGDTYPAPDDDMLAFYQTLGQLRRDNSALREGNMITLLTDDATGIYAFLRTAAEAGNAVLVVLNNSDSDQTVDLSLAGLLPSGVTLAPALGGDPLDLNGAVSVSVGANSGNVWTLVGAPFTLPAAPANLQVSGESGRVSLTWDAVEGAAGYQVYRSPVAVGGFEPITTEPVSGGSYRDESVSNGLKYYYAVAAVGADGLVGPRSDSIAAIPSAPIGAAFYVGDDESDPAQTYAPTEMMLSAQAQVDVEAGIRIEGVTDAEGAAQGVRAEAALIPAGTTLEDAAWEPMQYGRELNGADVYSASFRPQAAGDYQAVARFSTNAGESWTVVQYRDGSFPAVTIQPSDDATPPDGPAAVRIDRPSPSGVVLSWDPSPSEDVYAYRVYRLEGNNVTLVAEVPAAEATYTDKGVAANKRYAWGISAVDNALNESEPVRTERVKVEKAKIAVTFNVTVPDYTEGQVFIAGAFASPDYPNWNPAGIEMEQVDATHWTVTLNLPEDAAIEYKYVRNGTWDAVEKDKNCQEIANRRLKVTLPANQDTLTVEDAVEKWRDLDQCG